MSPDIEACKAALAGYDIDDNPATVQQKSRDFYWYSPILKRQLNGVTGDFVIAPRDEAEVVEILATCWRHNVPVTTRGAGTGNYGQAMPLNGGVVLHMRNMDKVLHVGDDHLVAQSGAVIASLESTARTHGREIRLFPSTTSAATIGGFIAGGAGGVGAIRWGGLRNPSNIRRLRLVTMEREPRVVDLVGPDVHKAAHAYGVNGVITEVEIPIDPSSDWIDVLIGVDTLRNATLLSVAIGEQEGIRKRMLSTFQAPIAELYFGRYRPHVVAGEAVIATMVSAETLPALVSLVDAVPHAELRFRADQAEAKGLPALFEMAWNHTTLRALRVDPTITYLQMMFPRETLFERVDDMVAAFGDEVLLHLEFTRYSGVVTPIGIPLIRYTTEARLEEITMKIEAMGLPVFNPHRVTLEEGGMKRTDPAQLAFKKATDPKGLLNPGKMIAWTDPDWVPEPGKTFLFGDVASGA